MTSQIIFPYNCKSTCNNVIKCISVDDEPLALRLMEDYISKVSFLEPVAFCADGIEASKILQQRPIDLVFLDIQMPGLTGLDLIRSQPGKSMFILTTAYEKFALEGYNLDVVDYLLKPVEFSRFLQAANKAKELFDLRHNSLRQESTDEYFFVNIEYSLVKVIINEVEWIEGVRDYVKIHLKTGKPLMVRMSMKSIEEKLPETKFIRIHKSYIVAIKSIHSIRKNSIFIGANELPIGETYKPGIDNITGRY